ncbi:MAG: hypothetical protein JXA14_05850, partial [Anaerolineae bacterium]|nr:hypothetical protein [Anaerolineae bacterium]
MNFSLLAQMLVSCATRSCSRYRSAWSPLPIRETSTTLRNSCPSAAIPRNRYSFCCRPIWVLGAGLPSPPLIPRAPSGPVRGSGWPTTVRASPIPAKAWRIHSASCRLTGSRRDCSKLAIAARTAP